MIINNIADAQVTDERLVTFNPRDIKYSIEGGSGKLEGIVEKDTYRDVDVKSLGSGPYQVTLGYVNDSWRAAPVEVSRANALVTFWMAFPAGPNGPQSFVYSKS